MISSQTLSKFDKNFIFTYLKFEETTFYIFVYSEVMNIKSHNF